MISVFSYVFKPRLFDLEEIDQAAQVFHLAGGGDRFFGGGGVLLGDFFHLPHGGVGLVDAGALFFESDADFAYEVRRLLDAGYDFLQQLARRFGNGNAIAGEAVDLLG